MTTFDKLVGWIFIAGCLLLFAIVAAFSRKLYNMPSPSPQQAQEMAREIGRTLDAATRYNAQLHGPSRSAGDTYQFDRVVINNWLLIHGLPLTPGVGYWPTTRSMLDHPVISITAGHEPHVERVGESWHITFPQ